MIRLVKNRLGLMVGLFVLLFSNAQAQVVNGSFETSGGPDLSGWTTICDTGTFIQDVPVGGGNWSLYLDPGASLANVCALTGARAYQILPGINDGEKWKLSGWVKVDSWWPFSWPPASINFGKMDSSGAITLLSADTTSSQIWTLLSIEDSISLLPGESAVVVLRSIGNSYFDQISVQQVGATGIESFRSNKIDVKTYPNPFRSSTTIAFEQVREDPYDFKLYDLQGRLLRTVNDVKSGQVIERENLESGLYFFQLTVDGQIQASGKMVIE